MANKLSSIKYRNVRMENVIPGEKYPSRNIVVDYDFRVNDETRELEVVEIGKTDITALIQSHADEVGVYNQIRKFMKVGIDITSPDASNPCMYKPTQAVDISMIPDDVNELFAIADSKNAIVEKLNAVLGTTYSAEQFLNLGQDKIKSLLEEKTKKVESEVK